MSFAWLDRNLSIKNGNDPRFKLVLELISDLKRCKIKLTEQNNGS